MYDGGKIVAGLIVFLAVVTSPIWYNVVTGKAEYKPEPKIVTQEKECVAPKAWMTAMHMTLLNDWRDSVVREGNRMYVAANGKAYNMSLQRYVYAVSFEQSGVLRQVPRLHECESVLLGLPR